RLMISLRKPLLPVGVLLESLRIRPSCTGTALRIWMVISGSWSTCNQPNDTYQRTWDLTGRTRDFTRIERYFHNSRTSRGVAFIYACPPTHRKEQTCLVNHERLREFYWLLSLR